MFSLNKNTFLQTNKKIGDWCESAKFLKINEMEYNNSKSYIDKKENDTVLNKIKSEIKLMLFNNRDVILWN